MASYDIYLCPDCYGSGLRVCSTGVFADCLRCDGRMRIRGPLTDEEMAKVLAFYKECRDYRRREHWSNARRKRKREAKA
jgi:hypothetical protein